MDLSKDADLLWIAIEGLVPSPWKPCKSGSRDIFYYNFGGSQWEHPVMSTTAACAEPKRP